MIVTTSLLLKKAKAGAYAVPALNVDNLESVMGILLAAKSTGKSVIIQTIPRTLAYGGEGSYIAMVRALYDGGADIAMHLDHGGDEGICARCIELGYTSVMIDGSALPFEENVALTKRVADFAHSRNVSAEGELGTIGGKEETAGSVSYTDPKQAEEFADLTGADSLAVGVGTAHGVYKGTPRIAVDRIYEIASRTDVPLVLHGASGLSREVVRSCIAAGICKINFATQLRQAFTSALRRSLAAHPEAFDPKLYLPDAVEAVKNAAEEIIDLCYS